jgi:hypothetical protein
VLLLLLLLLAPLPLPLPLPLPPPPRSISSMPRSDCSRLTAAVTVSAHNEVTRDSASDNCDVDGDDGDGTLVLLGPRP